MNIKIVFTSLLLFVALISFGQNVASTKTVIYEGDTLILESINITNINSRIEEALQTIKQIETDTKPDNDIRLADSIYYNAIDKLNKEKEKILDEEINTNLRNYADAIQQWKNYKSKLSFWQTIVSERTELLSDRLFKTDNRLIIWKLTLNDAKKENAPNELILNIGKTIANFKALRYDLNNELLNIYSKQTKVTEVSLLIDSTINELKDRKLKLRKEYLIQDAPALWNSLDSTMVKSFSSGSYASTLSNTEKAFSVFYEANNKNIYLHMFLLLIFIFGFYFLKKQSIIIVEDNKFAVKVLNYNILNAIFITLLSTIWVYSTRQIVVDDIFQLFTLVIALFILPDILHKDFRSIIILSIALHLLNQIHLYSLHFDFVNRMIMLVEAIVAFLIFRQLLARDGAIRSSILPKYLTSILLIIKILFILLIIPVIANIFGFVGLAAFVNNGIFNTLFNGIIFLGGILIIKSALTVILKLEYVLKSHIIKKHFQSIENYSIIAVGIFFTALWLRGSLRLFEVYDSLMKWFSGLFLASWEIGEISIELGTVLSFILVIFITTVLVRLIKILLEEEVFSRITLPRGVPGAISMIIRYFIVGWGIVISIMALGVEMSQFSLMAGALGVGIGFGLQNVVFNFIAGLILAFERPIQVGDTVELETVSGIVKSIGVRSSTIRTFEGSEVIVPNGNLISNDVINWTLSDRRKRRDIFVGVEYGSDPHKVMEILKTAANGNINVLQNPEPWVLFDGFGESSLKFRLRIWTSMDVSLTTKSEVTIAIYDGLTQAGLKIPFPQTDLHLKSVEPQIEKIILEKKEITINKPKTTK